MKNFQGEFNENSDTIFMNKFDTDYLLDNDGITIGETKTRQQTYNAYSIPGVVMENITYATGKSINIAGWVVDNPLGSMALKKKNIERFFNPLEKFRLEFGDRYIDGYPKTTIKYGEKYKDNNDTFCKFMIEFFCPYPFFTAKESVRYYPYIEWGSRVGGASIIDNYIPNADGTVGLGGQVIPFQGTAPGQSEAAYDLAKIHNPSDCDIGFKLVIDFDDNSAPESPPAPFNGMRVDNYTTGEFFKAGENDLKGQYVFSSVVNDKYFVDGNGDSALDDFDPAGSFFLLKPGDNYITIRYPKAPLYNPTYYMHIKRLYFEITPEYYYVSDEEE